MAADVGYQDIPKMYVKKPHLDPKFLDIYYAVFVVVYFWLFWEFLSLEFSCMHGTFFLLLICLLSVNSQF